MSQPQINLNPDLMKLREAGYEVEVRGGYLLVHHIPYVNSNRQVNYGSLVCPLSSNAGKTLRPQDHLMYFTGDHPCNLDGSIISAIQHTNSKQQFLPGLVVYHSFSNKPPQGYADYFEKMDTYAKIITAPAMAVDKTASPFTFRVLTSADEQCVFEYPDTNSTRANIGMISAKLRTQKVAIVGLGGTGGYVLDQLAKTPVLEIHLFDGDRFLQHNAFRSPGAPTLKQLDAMQLKVEYYRDRYSAMHKHIIAHPYPVTESNLHKLDTMTTVFICVDKNRVRKMLMAHLIKKKILFIDSGIGVEIVGDALIGAVRVTTGSVGKTEHLATRVPTVDDEDEKEAYHSNIQIADLNMLNAFMAVHKWKKTCGFYQDLIGEHNSIYSINSAHLDSSEF